jgi:hypothetical protein
MLYYQDGCAVLVATGDDASPAPLVLITIVDARCTLPHICFAF